MPRRLPWVLLGALVLTQICYPLTSGSTRAAATVLTVVLGYLLSVSHALLSRGTRAAAALVAFTIGGGIGWVARGAAATPTAMQTLTLEAMDAHRLYVVEVRHPVEVPGDERAHLQQWLTRRCGWEVRAPELDAAGLKLVGGRLLPGPAGPASFLMYEGASGERFTVYSAKTTAGTTQMRYAAQGKDTALFWAERGVGFVVSGSVDRDRLTQIAKLIYDQSEKIGG